MVDHDALVKERGSEYGESWRMTSQWIVENAALLAQAGDAAFPMVMMHNKLARALTSPLKQDHWDDMIGYAKLALQAIERRPANHWLVEKEEGVPKYNNTVWSSIGDVAETGERNQFYVPGADGMSH